MRKTLLMLAFLAIPSLAVAQQPAGDAGDATEAAPTVQLERSVPSPDAATATADAPAPDLPAVAPSHAPDQPAAVQEGGPGTRGWWYLVGAIVLGGIILAAVL